MFPSVVRRAVPFALKWSKVASVSSKRYISNKNQTLAASAPSLKINWREFESEKAKAVTVDFDYVKKAIEDKNVLIIDVREPEEIMAHGNIPNSINIPLGVVTPVFSQLSDEEFSEKYGRPKPGKDDEIIFYCKIGKRSAMAQYDAQKLGYNNVKNYLGSFTEWKIKRYYSAAN